MHRSAHSFRLISIFMCEHTNIKMSNLWQPFGVRIDGTCQKLLLTGGFVRYDVTGWQLCISAAPPFCLSVKCLCLVLSVKCYGRCNTALRYCSACIINGFTSPAAALCSSSYNQRITKGGYGKIPASVSQIMPMYSIFIVCLFPFVCR